MRQISLPSLRLIAYNSSLDIPSRLFKAHFALVSIADDTFSSDESFENFLEYSSDCMISQLTALAVSFDFLGDNSFSFIISRFFDFATISFDLSAAFPLFFAFELYPSTTSRLYLRIFRSI